MEIFMKRYILLFLCLVYGAYNFGLCTAFFAPNDNLTALLIESIQAEKKSIYAAVYMFTDKKIAQSLIDAQKRGVDVQVVIDQISMSSYGKGKFLQDNGITVFIHKTQEFNQYCTPLMHHKFFVFGFNKNDQSLVWTGSWNCTVRGTKCNDENVLVLDDQSIVQAYLQAFELLKNRILKAAL